MGLMMTIPKALITAAGRSQRHLPLQTIVEENGYPRSVLSHLVDEAASAGIEEIGVVIVPEDRELYSRAAEGARGRITFLEQAEPLGYGHAISCGREFLGEDPFLLMVSDHIYTSKDATKSCARQLVDFAAAEGCPVSAVQSTHEGSLFSFGAVGGHLYEGRQGVYLVEKVLEKPTPTLAEQELLVPGLRVGHYLCFFGMHVLTAEILRTVCQLVQDAENPKSINLATALDAAAGSERLLAQELAGRRFDLQRPHGLLHAQLALALQGTQREEVLSELVSLLADSR